MNMSSRHARERGIALILVLWILILLTVIASGLAFSTRTETILTGNQVALARARALANAGVYRGLYELLKPATDLETGWRADGRVHLIELEGARIEVAMVEETAFINLNEAPDALLRGLMLTAGVSEEEADRLVDTIVDWLDPDDLVRANGAEREQYEAAELGYVPTNGRFKSVDEVMRVMGMTRDIYRRIAPALTVHSGQAGINSPMAPRQALLALPNAAWEEVDAYIETREQLRAENQPVPAFPPAAPHSSAGGDVYNFKVVATLPDKTTYVRQAVARLTRDQHNPFYFLDWKEGSP